MRGTWKCERAAAAAAQLPVSALWHYTRHPRRPEARAARVFEAPSAKLAHGIDAGARASQPVPARGIGHRYQQMACRAMIRRRSRAPEHL